MKKVFPSHPRKRYLRIWFPQGRVEKGKIPFQQGVECGMWERCSFHEILHLFCRSTPRISTVSTERESLHFSGNSQRMHCGIKCSQNPGIWTVSTFSGSLLLLLFYFFFVFCDLQLSLHLFSNRVGFVAILWCVHGARTGRRCSREKDRMKKRMEIQAFFRGVP